jgi:hypothetical protein
VQPKIDNDSVYWAYRTELEPQSATHPIKTQSYGAIENALYLTANLTAPSELSITIGTVTRTVSLPAGSSDLKIPLMAGAAPSFVLVRGNATLARAIGEDEIRVRGDYPDYYYSTGSMRD